MNDIQVLELTGDGAADVTLRRLTLDAFANLAPAAAPKMRIIEMSPRIGRLSWRAFERMRVKAVDLLGSAAFAQRLHRAHVVHLDITGAVRDLQSTMDALRANAEVEAPIMIVDVAMPEGAIDVSRILQEWQDALEADRPARAGVIERAPPQSAPAETAARTLLEQLLADPMRFTDSSTVGRALTGNPHHNNPKMAATRARKAGEIFGVWDGNAYRYPLFQFGADGKPLPQVNALIEVLPRDADGSGRDAALWLFAPDAALDERTPADLFPENPQRVIDLARERRDGSDLAA